MKSITIGFACLLLTAPLADAKPRARVTHAPISKVRIDIAATTDYAVPGLALVTIARFYVGTNPTDMNRLWCARFMRFILRRAGYGDPGPAFDAANSFRRIGHPGTPQPGTIVIWSRGGNRGHVGIIVRLTSPAKAIVISGNDGPAGGRQVMERERSITGASFRHL